MTGSGQADAPLRGIRILSLAEQYPGPFATMLLADMGADVVLVERPAGGDPSRRYAGHFEALNRNKRSVAVDLKAAAGRDIFWRLASTADVILEGYKPGTVSRLGIGPRQARVRVPGLIYVSVSSFGQTGPMGQRGAHDLSVQGMAGLIDPDRRVPAQLPLADLAAGMFAALGIVSALLGRERAGSCSYVDVSMLDSLLSWRTSDLVSSWNRMTAAPYPPEDPGSGVFATGSGDLVTLSIAGEDHQWRALCDLLGLHDLAKLTAGERGRRRRDVSEALGAAIAAADWERVGPALAAAGIGFGPVHDDAQIAVDPQVRARGLAVTVPAADGVRFVRQPILFDGAGGSVRCRAPRLGEHTASLLAELGCSGDQVDALAATGVILVGA
jgi:crotonobetainyl-CoA:carnitine CoA-transferase CaiB-like acyl-CoA transferase